MTSVLVLPRAEFLQYYWDYRPGQHVTLLAPTDYGKTWFAHELLRYCASPELPALDLVMKPRDSTAVKWGKALGFRTVRQWPPLPSPLHMKPAGWVVWPKHVMDPVKDNPAHYRVFRAAILDSYKRGKRIIMADEVAGLCDLGLTDVIVTVLTKGRSMGAGLWCCTQRPSGIPLAAYSQASHLFLGNNPDDRDRKRYAEIGGVNPKLVSETVSKLRRFQWLYVKRHGEDGAELCIVDV